MSAPLGICLLLQKDTYSAVVMFYISVSKVSYNSLGKVNLLLKIQTGSRYVKG